jgi:hypothetical protein
MKEIIEVGDTVRVLKPYNALRACYASKAGAVEDVDGVCCGIRMEDGSYVGAYVKDVELIRKSKKEAPMSKRPRLEEIDSKMLLKLRDGSLYVCFCDDAAERIYSDIVAFKRYAKQGDAIKALTSGAEPVWDWQESDDVPLVTFTKSDLDKLAGGKPWKLDADGMVVEGGK